MKAWWSHAKYLDLVLQAAYRVEIQRVQRNFKKSGVIGQLYPLIQQRSWLDTMIRQIEKSHSVSTSLRFLPQPVIPALSRSSNTSPSLFCSSRSLPTTTCNLPLHLYKTLRNLGLKLKAEYSLDSMIVCIQAEWYLERKQKRRQRKWGLKLSGSNSIILRMKVM